MVVLNCSTEYMLVAFSKASWKKGIAGSHSPFWQAKKLHSNFTFINAGFRTISCHLNLLPHKRILIKSLWVTRISLPTLLRGSLNQLPIVSHCNWCLCLVEKSIHQEVSITLVILYQINKYKYLMSWPFCSTHSACFKTVSSYGSAPEYISTEIKMPFCPRIWHLARRGSTLVKQR